MGALIWAGPGAFWEIPNYGTVAKGQTITVPDALANQLYAQDSSWWIPTNGFVPSTPPVPASVQAFGGFANTWDTDLVYVTGTIVLDAYGNAWVATLVSMGETPGDGSAFWSPFVPARAPLVDAIPRPANMMSLTNGGGTPTLGTNVSSGATAIQSWHFVHGSVQAVGFTIFEWPEHWLAYAVDVYWSCDAAGSGTVDFQWAATTINPGSGTTGSGGQGPFAAVQSAANSGLNVQAVTTIVASSVPVTPSDTTACRIFRIGTSGNDTFTGSIAIAGAIIRRTA
jgi:hypothetical protein